jgi:hypothetical protein
MIFKYAIVFLFCAFVNTSVFCQNANQLFLEAGGPAGYGSMNYARKIISKQKFNVYTGAGLMLLNVRDFNRKINPDVIMPIRLMATLGQKHQLEFGAAIILVHYNLLLDGETKRATELNYSPIVGYKLQPKKERFFYRLFYSPIFSEHLIKHWAGASIGLNLGKP